MTDYFALMGEARRPWLDAAALKQKFHARNRAAAPDAQWNEAFRVLSEPKLRLQHLLALEGMEAAANRAVPAAIADFSWETGTLLREIDEWLGKSAKAGSDLVRALLARERVKLEERWHELEEKLSAHHETTLAELAETNLRWPNERAKLVQLYDSISYLTRLREQLREKQFQLRVS